MKLLYLDCSMGAAGDMLTASLLELFPQKDEILKQLNSLGIPNVSYEAVPAKKCGICGTQMRVLVSGREEDCGHTHEHAHEQAHTHAHAHAHVHAHHSAKHSHEHVHTGLHEIEHLICSLNISEKVKSDVLCVYQLIADAESTVHGVPVSQIHFHEVGSMDAVADITAVCYLLDLLAPDKIISSPIQTGSGQIRCAHGILPVPAPATALLLRDCPIYGGKIAGELCTPTGAALLKYFVSEFGNLPAMCTTAIGYGMGKKDFEAANCVRALFGSAYSDAEDTIWQLSCNVDDMTAEQIGYALEIFFKEGALDAFTIPVMMKKNRPGTLIQVLCSTQRLAHLINMMFAHTTTAGIRKQSVSRNILHRQLTEIETPYGVIRRKDYSGYGVTRSKYEYEDLAAAARTHGISLAELLQNIDG